MNTEFCSNHIARFICFILLLVGLLHCWFFFFCIRRILFPDLAYFESFLCGAIEFVCSQEGVRLAVKNGWCVFGGIRFLLCPLRKRTIAELANSIILTLDISMWLNGPWMEWPQIQVLARSLWLEVVYLNDVKIIAPK